MKTLPALIFALLLAACSANPFVVPVPAPTMVDPPVQSNDVAKTDKLVPVPLPKPRPQAHIKRVKVRSTVPFETALLPYSCATVKWAHQTFPKDFIDKAGANLTDAQKAEAARCMK